MSRINRIFSKLTVDRTKEILAFVLCSLFFIYYHITGNTVTTCSRYNYWRTYVDNNFNILLLL